MVASFLLTLCYHLVHLPRSFRVLDAISTKLLICGQHLTIDAIQHGNVPWKVYQVHYQGPFHPDILSKWMTESCSPPPTVMVHRDHGLKFNCNTGVSDQQGYLKPLGFEGRVTVGPPDPRGTPDAIAGGDNREVTEEMSEDATGGGRQEKQQEGGGGENGCYGNVQWEVRGTAGGWRWQEWMLWQGKVAHVAGKGPEKQGDEEVVEMDVFMRCSSVHVEERWGRQPQSG
ncbi:hypothetical protein BGW80DRAFT_1256116 [Lactifluus volemus]|nr:hypothetical protein BGW80DRAFT_1256116 [Lactifluus volemus]